MVTVRGDVGEDHFGHVDAEAVRLIDPAGIGDPTAVPAILLSPSRPPGGPPGCPRSDSATPAEDRNAVERLERTGHPAQVAVAVGGEVHFSPAAAGRLVPSQGRQGGELADGKGTPYLIGELWSAATTSCHEDVGIRRFMASEDGLTV